MQWTGTRARPFCPKTRSRADLPKLQRQRPIGSVARKSRKTRRTAQRAPSCPTTTTRGQSGNAPPPSSATTVEKAEQERPRRHRPRVLFPRGRLRQIHRRLPGLPQIHVALLRKTPMPIMRARLLRQPQNRETLPKLQQSFLATRGSVGLHVS